MQLEIGLNGVHFSLLSFLILINRAGGLYGRLLTEVASTLVTNISLTSTRPYAPINVNPVGGSAGKGWGFDKGIHLLSGRFDRAPLLGGRDIWFVRQRDWGQDKASFLSLEWRGFRRRWVFFYRYLSSYFKFKSHVVKGMFIACLLIFVILPLGRDFDYIWWTYAAPPLGNWPEFLHLGQIPTPCPHSPPPRGLHW